jgi:hypothetical protein
MGDGRCHEIGIPIFFYIICIYGVLNTEDNVSFKGEGNVIHYFPQDCNYA